VPVDLAAPRRSGYFGVDVTVVLIRAATAADAEAIGRVHVAAIREICAPFYEAEQSAAWSSGGRVSRYLEPIATQVFLVAVAGDEVVGFSELAPDVGEVRAVYVRPDRVRQRIGSELLGAVEAAARARALPRLRIESSINAVPFYERHGYVSDGAGVAVLRSGARLPCVNMHKDWKVTAPP
jgi:putative acetyltransferase